MIRGLFPFNCSAGPDRDPFCSRSVRCKRQDLAAWGHAGTRPAGLNRR